ncbi:hypothetical protein HDV06_005449 [Boothiomyces sp. JEL0866]|nr:hypothetical protein HDV06_005449 [Boothiomyces sp. JEL0866]
METIIALPEPVSKANEPSSYKALFLSYDSVGYAVAVVVWIVLSTLNPFERPYDTNDTSISHPHLSDFVSFNVVLALDVIVPPILFFAVYRNLYNTVAAYYYYTLGAFVVFGVTQYFKLICGRLRPDFLSRLATGDSGLISDGRQSFPSGHASVAFYGAGFVVFWMFDVVNLLGIRVGKKLGNAHAVILALLLLAWPSYVAVSRTQQYVHFPTDVIAGSALGLVISFIFCYIRKSP